MNTTWNPHTKKPRVSSQKPRWRAASRIAWATVCWRAPATAPVRRSTNADESGTIIAPSAAMTRSADIQPRLPISVCPTGTIMNCPKEPAAPVMPSAALRFSGFTARPITPYTTLKVVPESPRPMSSPALPASASPLVEAAIRTSPST